MFSKKESKQLKPLIENNYYFSIFNNDVKKYLNLFKLRLINKGVVHGV